MKIIGYGICGEGEAKRYMRQTLDCFKKLCDVVVILGNGASRAEQDLIESYGFIYRSDKREWGKHQWRIKQDLLERDILQIAEKGDMMVCLDMDEVLDDNVTKEWLLSAPLDAYHVFVVDLWNDIEHYKPDSCFWNVRIWRWNGETSFKAKPVHCGLAPEWTYFYHRHAPFILKHYGLMLEEDRLRRVERYKRYDPKAEYLDQRYYDMLKSNTATLFDETAIHNKIAKEVESYKQTKPTVSMTDKKKERFAYVKNPHGITLDIPEKHLKETLSRPGFIFVSWADDTEKEMDELFKDTEIDSNGLDSHPNNTGAYQRSIESEQRELTRLNNQPEPGITSNVFSVSGSTGGGGKAIGRTSSKSSKSNK